MLYATIINGSKNKKTPLFTI